MSAYLICIAFYAVASCLVGYLTLRWYDATVGRRERLRMFQHRFYALRDRAMRLVADGIMEEDDDRWQILYRHLNESAKASNVDRLQNSHIQDEHSFVLDLLMKVSPPEREKIAYQSLPSEAQSLWRDYVCAVLETCSKGISPSMLETSAGDDDHRFKDLLKRKKMSAEEIRYQDWVRSAHDLSPVACQ